VFIFTFNFLPLALLTCFGKLFLMNFENDVSKSPNQTRSMLLQILAHYFIQLSFIF
jgi:hypothetical protein